MLHHRQLKFLCALIIVMGVMFIQTMTEPALAQTNLLKDPGFENGTFNVIADTTSTGGVLCTVPSDWGGWIAPQPASPNWKDRQPACTGNSDKVNGFVRSGNRSHEFSRGQATFTAAIYQTVSVATGTNLVGQVYYVMDVKSGSTAQVRVGIDPNGGTNPFDSDIVWSNWGGVRRNTDGFGPLTVNATATGTSVTLFLYATQPQANTDLTDPNKTFFDDASLVAGGSGGAVASGTPLFTSTPTVPPVPIANFVVPQGTVKDGFIVHTVVEGDTLAAIATAYRVPIETLRELNPEIGRGSFLFIGQSIRIREATSETATPTRGANFQPAVTATPAGNSNVSATNTPAGNTVATNTPAPTLTTVPRTQGNTVIFVTQTPRGGASNPTATTQPTATPTEEVVATEEPTQITEEPTQITEEVTQAVVATAEITEVIQPTNTPVPTNTVPAPVVEPTVVAMNPETTITGACVTFFDDVNRNRFVDEGEMPIVGGIITLRLDNTDVSSFLTEGNPEPFCFDNLTPGGNYVVVVNPPTGYGMTTPSQFQLRVIAGERLEVPFGAAAGVVEPTVAVQTQPEQPAVVEQPAQTAPTTDNNDGLLANLGIIILALAGFTLISGIIGTILISRRG